MTQSACLLGQHAARIVDAANHEHANFFLDLARGLFRDVARLHQLVAEEHFALVFGVEKPQRVTIARARRVACSMSERAGGDIVHAPNFSSSATRPPIMIARREIISVCSSSTACRLRQLHDHAERTAARDDRRLVHRVGRRRR
jgi:hypothetical protein